METWQQIILKAVSCLGTPYIWGGSTPETGLDCSGLVVWILKEIGKVPQDYDDTANGLWHKYGLSYDVAAPQPGDLVFYGSTGVSHVMIALNASWCIGATPGDHTTVTKEIAAKQGAYVKVRPLNYRADLAGFGRIT